jgi:hypothetical protein
MTATLQLSRPFRLADLVWPYEIELDGQPAGEITNRKRTRLEVAPGSHVLQVRSLHVVNRWLGLSSPSVTFDVRDGERADFVCHVRPFVQAVARWIVCLVGDRTRWISLERA